MAFFKQYNREGPKSFTSLFLNCQSFMSQVISKKSKLYVGAIFPQDLFIYSLIIQRLKKCTVLAEIAILPSGPL